MKLFKGMMYGAAAVATAATAQAADLPVAPEPVDYVRICDAYGARFFYIPGTETCLRVGGRIRADYRFTDMADDSNQYSGNNWGRNSTSDATQFRARSYIYLDARTQTEFGLLRAFSDTWFTTNNSGIGAGVSQWSAFIQWGGFTFGKTSSFFDYWTGENWGSQIGAGLDAQANVLAYTATFGNGFSASVSVEHAEGGRGAVISPVRGATITDNRATNHKIPNFVAALRVTQGWGGAQLSGVIQDNRHDTAAVDGKVGWAIAGSASINLPMLGANDTLGLRAAYADGAVGYVRSNWTGVIGDANTNAAGTSLSNTTAWGLAAGLTHFWTPEVSTALTGTYSSYDGNINGVDAKVYSLHGQVAWTPVSGLVIGTEVEWQQADFNRASNINDADTLTATFRVQRTF